jgi:hypothetical protein
MWGQSRKWEDIIKMEVEHVGLNMWTGFSWLRKGFSGTLVNLRVIHIGGGGISP